jgi:hypothetical protein
MVELFVRKGEESRNSLLVTVLLFFINNGVTNEIYYV